MTGGTPGNQFSLVLLRPSGQSLLGSLSTAFARASLFKLSWLRPWAGWLLSVLLLARIGFGSAAISAAARDDPVNGGKDAGDEQWRDSAD